MTRVKYRKNGDMLESALMMANTKLIKVVINPSTLTYSIVAPTDNYSVLAEGQATSLASLKIDAKSSLITLGAKFDDELRNRGNIRKLDLNDLEGLNETI